MAQIKINDRLIEVIACYGALRNMLGAKRNSIEIIMTSDYETIKNTFVDGVEYSLIDTYDVRVEKEDGTIITETKTEEFNKTNYCLSGDIVDHRDGTISVFMGEKTNEELAIEQAEETEQLLYEVMFGME